MMKLSTIQKVMNTVDSEWRCSLAEQILGSWEYDKGSIFFYRASANVVCVFKTNGEIRFLRFIPINEKDENALQAEIDILLSLRDTDLRTAQPVQSLHGTYIEVVRTALGSFYAVVFEGAKGSHLDFEKLDEDHYFMWGKTLGKLHRNSKMLPREKIETRKSWMEHLQQVQKSLPMTEVEALQECRRIEAWAFQLPITEENFGLIHYDFELDNLCWNEEDVTIIDFDDCTLHWYVADIAYALRSLFEENYDPTNLFFQEFMKGYESESKIDHSLLQQLPWFYRLHRLVMFARLLESVDVNEAQGHPDWLNGLTRKLDTKINVYRQAFVLLDKNE
ncbi:phosphotransferase enzyme family protein [Fredinandcohnia humi]